ncbi:hypothetical protein P7H17_00100 [Paenibacillus larvae]|nr:hypothetical protein [Paenibacillus larvae]MDT2284842.1 hypothetical protein [Paenibacillus larvae]
MVLLWAGTFPQHQNRVSRLWTGTSLDRHWGEVNGSGGRKAYQMVVYTNKEALASYGEIYATLWNGDIKAVCELSRQDIILKLSGITGIIQ